MRPISKKVTHSFLKVSFAFIKKQKTKHPRAGGVAHQVKRHLLRKPDHLSLIPGTLRVDERRELTSQICPDCHLRAITCGPTSITHRHI